MSARAVDVEMVEPDEELVGDEIDILMDDPVAKPRRRGWLIVTAVLAVGAAGGAWGYTYFDQHPQPSGVNAIAPPAVDTSAPVPPPATTVVAAPAPAPAPAPAVAPLVVDSPTAGFVLRGIPDGTGVNLDGKPLGSGPMKVSRLTAGTHQLELIAPAGFQNHSVDVVLVADQIVELTVALDPVATTEPAPETAPAPAPVEAVAAVESPSPKRERRSKHKAKKIAEVKAARGGGEGVLMVNAKPPCEIIIDGKKTGLTTPQRSISLPAGKHTITLRNKAHGVERTSKTVVKSGETSRLVVDLTDEM